jgi:hypothetical protein
MFDNAALDISVGLVLMYLVLSLMGTVVNEFISTALGLRAATLKSALVNLLDNPNLRAEFYKHGLIDGTQEATGGPASYISGDTFALAILNSLSADNPLPGFDDAKTAIQNMPDSNIRDALLAQLTKANGDLNALRTNIANYYDGAMDRVSGIYKRYMKWISLAVGFLIVIVLNADSINVGAALWKDAALRAQMAQVAGSVLTSEKPAAAGAAATPGLAQRLNMLDADIRPLPIGVTAVDVKQFFARSALAQLFSLAGLWWLMAKLTGLAITAFAISLGAPFWFDMLSKIMNVRGTGAKPASTTSQSN